MKLLKLFEGGPSVAGCLLLVSCMPLLAAEPAVFVSNQATVGASPNAAVNQPNLPYGVEDILKLTRAQVSEDVIVNFIGNSGTIYNLSPNDIVYLRHEGVSDRVINAMLEKHKKALDAAQNQPASTPPAPAAPAAPPLDTAATAPPNPAPVYVQQPAQPAPSTVYVVPYPAANAACYGYYPYYGYYAPYYAPYYGPSISLGFRFGGGWGGYWGGGHHWHH